MRWTAGWLVAGTIGCGQGAAPEAPPAPPAEAPRAPTEVAPPSPATPLPAPAPAAAPVDDGPRFGVASADVTHDGAPATLTAVRHATHPGYDRVVFEFDHVPGFHVGYVAAAFRCGSGAPVIVDGKAILEVSLRPAQAHDAEGKPTVPERSAKTPDLPVLRQLESTCDFEGTTTWALGVDKKRMFRAFELQDPPRLVVDVQQ